MPATATSERPRLHRGRVRLPARHRLTIWLVRLFCVLVVTGLAGAGWYLARKGFSRSWRNRVVAELHKHGVEASVRRLTLDPFRGLIARDVRIYDYRNRQKTLAVVSQISLDVNYAALFHHQAFLNALDIRNADLTIPLPPAQGQLPAVELKNFRAHIYFPPEQIEVSQAEGLFYGIRVSVSGQLIKHENYAPSSASRPGEAERRLRLLQKMVTVLQPFRYPGGPASLQVKFSGDLSRLENARVEATLRGNRIEHGDYRAHQLAATFEWKDQTLTIPQFEWNDSKGQFSGAATWRHADGQASFQSRSTIDLKGLLGSFGFGALLADLHSAAAPLVETSGWATIGGAENKVELIGHISLGQFDYKGADFDGLATDFAWTGNRTMLRDLRLQHRTGRVTADLLDAPNDFRLNLDSTIAPDAFAALAPADLRAFLAEWSWQRAPSIRLSVHGTSQNPSTWNGDGSLSFGRTRFRGVWMRNASADIHLGDKSVSFDHVHVAREEGSASGGFGFDWKNREIRLTNVQSTLRPTDVIMWIEPRFWKFVSPYRFHRPPHVTSDGVVQLGGGKLTHLQITVDAPAGMDYTFLDKVLPFERIGAQLLFTEDRLQILGLNGRLFSGKVTGTADISLAPNDRHYTARLAVADVDFPSLTELYFKYTTSQGALSGNFDFTGDGTNPAALNGNGQVEVRNGNVFAIPIFGPLSELLNKLFAGAGYSVAHEASAPFSIHDGIIHTKNLKVSGKLFAMLGHGSFNFLQNKLDFDLRIGAGGAGAVLTPLYKLFEYHGEGSLTKPIWRPKRF